MCPRKRGNSTSFRTFVKSRALEVNYSGGDRLKGVLWGDEREHTTALGALVY
jgi:hypothetical protein